MELYPGLLAAGAQEAGLLTVADAVGQDATLVTRVRADPSVAHGLNLELRAAGKTHRALPA